MARSSSSRSWRSCSCWITFSWAAFLSALYCLLSAFCMRSFSFSCGVNLADFGCSALFANSKLRSFQSLHHSWGYLLSRYFFSIWWRTPRDTALVISMWAPTAPSTTPMTVRWPRATSGATPSSIMSIAIRWPWSGISSAVSCPSSTWVSSYRTARIPPWARTRIWPAPPIVSSRFGAGPRPGRCSGSWGGRRWGRWWNPPSVGEFRPF